MPVKRVIDCDVKVRVKANEPGVDPANVKMPMNPFGEIADEKAIHLTKKGISTEGIEVSNGIRQSQETRHLTLAIEADRAILTKGTAEVQTDIIDVSSGRSMGSKESLNLIAKLADKQNSAIGAFRASVDAGFAPNDLNVVQTGELAARKLETAVGICGAVQHLAGMKGLKAVVAAVKKVDAAPIFEVADCGLDGDLFTAVPELVDAL